MTTKAFELHSLCQQTSEKTVGLFSNLWLVLQENCSGQNGQGEIGTLNVRVFLQYAA